MSSRRKQPGAAKGGRQPPSSARAVAFRVLRGLDDGRAQPAALFERHGGSELSGVDRDLAMELVHGVLRWRGRLDHIIAAHAKRPAASLDRAVRLSLRLGLYQLRFLDRIPEHAAVDESVRLAKAFGAARGSGLVNAVLRSALRRPSLPAVPEARDGESDEERVERLALSTSHPPWLVRRYLERLGPARAERRLEIHNRPPPVYLRAMGGGGVALESVRASLAEDGVQTELSPIAPRCLRILAGRFHGSRVEREGLALVQDAGSQLVPALVGVRPKDRVLDLCAAPGGKSTLLAELAPEGSVTAVELRIERARALARLSRKTGAPPVRVVAADGRRLPFSEPFSRVLLDAPCSSLGTLRRNPDIKWHAREDDLEALAAVELALLLAVAAHVAPGGRLVYATCSTEREENESVVEAFLRERRDFRLGFDLASLLPESARHLVRDDGMFATAPERDDTDGYFAAALIREDTGADAGVAKPP